MMSPKNHPCNCGDPDCPECGWPEEEEDYDDSDEKILDMMEDPDQYEDHRRHRDE